MFTPGEDSHFDSYFSTGWFNHQLDHRRCWPPARQKACLVPTAATAESLGLPGVVLTDKNHGMTVVISNILYFHPYLGKWSDLTDIFQMGWNHQLENYHQKTAGWNSEKMLRCILRKAAILMCACMWGMKHLWRRRGLKIDPLCHVVFFFTPIGRFSCSCQLFCFFFQAAGRSLCQPQWMKWEVLDVQSLFTCPSKPWLWKNGDPYTFTQSGVRSHKKLSNTPHPSQQKKNGCSRGMTRDIHPGILLTKKNKNPMLFMIGCWTGEGSRLWWIWLAPNSLGTSRVLLGHNQESGNKVCWLDTGGFFI